MFRCAWPGGIAQMGCVDDGGGGDGDEKLVSALFACRVLVLVVVGLLIWFFVVFRDV